MGYETVCVWSSPSFLLLRLDLSPKAKFFKSSSNLKLPSFHFLFIEKLTFYIVQRKTLSEFSDSWIFFPFLLGAREGGTVKPPLTATSLQTPPCISRRIYYAFTLILTFLQLRKRVATVTYPLDNRQLINDWRIVFKKLHFYRKKNLIATALRWSVSLWFLSYWMITIKWFWLCYAFIFSK